MREGERGLWSEITRFRVDWTEAEQSSRTESTLNEAGMFHVKQEGDWDRQQSLRSEDHQIPLQMNWAGSLVGDDWLSTV